MLQSYVTLAGPWCGLVSIVGTAEGALAGLSRRVPAPLRHEPLARSTSGSSNGSTLPNRDSHAYHSGLSKSRR